MGARINALSIMLAALLVYIGVRLLAPFSLPAQILGGAVLLAVFWLLPKGFSFRSDQRWRIWAPWLMTGLFSWLLVLTVARDLLLVAGFSFVEPVLRSEWVRTAGPSSSSVRRGSGTRRSCGRRRRTAATAMCW